MIKLNRFKTIDAIVLAIALVFLVLLFGCAKSNTDVATPAAHFSYLGTTSFPFTVKFINQSAAAAPGAIYDWDMNDGTFYHDRPDSFIHVYATYGLYRPRLIKTETNGDRDTITVPIDLSDTTGPSGQSGRIGSASFTYRIVYTTIFYNTSTDASSYVWDFGDGTTSTESSASFSKDYDAPGAYTVKLKAINASNEVDSSTATITF